MKGKCMKVTSIRTKNGEIASTDTILKLERILKQSFLKAGFITDVTIHTRTAMKIGMHMCSFRIDASKLGHNADYGYNGSRCKAGYKLTTIPTWSQREQFNHLVNDAFDKLKLNATIKSGSFDIRNKTTGRIDLWYGGGDRLFEIKSIEVA